MKISILAIFLFLTSRCFALFGVGDIVYDPAQHTSNILHHVETLAQWAESIKKYEEMVSNGMKQIEEIQNVFQRTNTLVERVGDWKGVYDRAQNIIMRTEKLTQNWGEGFEIKPTLDYSTSSMSYTNNGLYRTVKLKTPWDNDVQIDKQELLANAALEQKYEFIKDTFEKSDQELKETYEQIAKVSEEANSASTQSEVQKATVKLQALQAKVSKIHAERTELIQRLEAERIMNQNDEEKKRKAANMVMEQTMQELGEEMKKQPINIQRLPR